MDARSKGIILARLAGTPCLKVELCSHVEFANLKVPHFLTLPTVTVAMPHLRFRNTILGHEYQTVCEKTVNAAFTDSCADLTPLCVHNRGASSHMSVPLSGREPLYARILAWNLSSQHWPYAFYSFFLQACRSGLHLTDVRGALVNR